jgi:hypothetical protein
MNLGERCQAGLNGNDQKKKDTQKHASHQQGRHGAIIYLEAVDVWGHSEVMPGSAMHDVTSEWVRS